MSRPDFINQLTQQASRLLKDGPDIQHDIEEKIQALVQARLRRMNVVSRDEFDAQLAVLNRTRAKLESLETQLAALSEQLETLQSKK